jgi:type IV secretory pathway VirJ component
MRADRTHILLAAIAMIALVLILTGCAGPLNSVPGTYTARTVPVKIAGRNLKVTYITPVAPRPQEMLILFASGDAGYWGVSQAIMKHLAEQRYYVVTYDARQIIAREQQSGKGMSLREVAALYDTILVDARRSVGSPEGVPVVVTGYSRGATMIVLAAAIDSLQHRLSGAVAIELTRRTDYLKLPARGDSLSSALLDAEGQIQTYAAIPLAGSLPFALIQATKDSYIGADEARELFGPDTPSRRFYRIEGSHALRGVHDVVMKHLDDALAWISGHAAAN